MTELDNVPVSEIEIVDNNARRFASYASVDVVDREGEVVPIDELKGVMPTIMSKGGNIMDSHSNKKVGNILNYVFTTKQVDGEKREALVILGEIDDKTQLDDQVWSAIKDGTYSGMSFGGAAEDTSLDLSYEEADQAVVLNGLEGYEFSVVETPANQESTMIAVNEMAKRYSPVAIAKSAGMVSDKEDKNKHVFHTSEEAEAVAEDLGISGSHEHEIEGTVYYMPGETHEDYEEAVKEDGGVTSDTSGASNNVFGEDVSPQFVLDLLFGEIPELGKELEQKVEELRKKYGDLNREQVGSCIEDKMEEGWEHDRAVAACLNMARSGDIGKVIESLKNRGVEYTKQGFVMPEQDENVETGEDASKDEEELSKEELKSKLKEELKDELVSELKEEMEDEDEEEEDMEEEEMSSDKQEDDDVTIGDFAELVAEEADVDIAEAKDALAPLFAQNDEGEKMDEDKIGEKVEEAVSKQFSELKKSLEVSETPRPNNSGKSVNKSESDDDDNDYEELLKSLADGETSLTRREKIDLFKEKMDKSGFTIKD